MKYSSLSPQNSARGKVLLRKAVTLTSPCLSLEKFQPCIVGQSSRTNVSPLWAALAGGRWGTQIHYCREFQLEFSRRFQDIYSYTGTEARWWYEFATSVSCTGMTSQSIMRCMSPRERTALGRYLDNTEEDTKHAVRSRGVIYRKNYLGMSLLTLHGKDWEPLTQATVYLAE